MEICSEILQCVKTSKLDFSIQQTPYSSYITIRHKLQKQFTNEVLPDLSTNNTNLNETKTSQMLALKEENSAQENEIECLNTEISALKEENCVQKNEIKLLHTKTKNLKDELTVSVRNHIHVKKESDSNIILSKQHETTILNLKT